MSSYKNVIICDYNINKNKTDKISIKLYKFLCFSYFRLYMNSGKIQGIYNTVPCLPTL